MKAYYEADGISIYHGDCRDVLSRLPDQSVQCCVTSPPYWGLRDYGHGEQLGLEATPELYVAAMVDVFAEVWRVLKNNGTVWLNLGDSYAGSWGAQSRENGNDAKSTLAVGSMLSARQIAAHPKRTETGSLKNTPGLKSKDIVGIPWRVAFALQADGWYLRQDIIWHKPNPMPESVTDRCTKAHEYIFLLAKSPKYYYDNEAIAEPVERGFCGSRFDTGKTAGHHLKPKRSGNTARKSATERDCPRDGVAGSVPWEGTTRNKRSVWQVSTKPYHGAHFATFPEDLIEPCILAGTRPGDIVLDPFGGSGTTAVVAKRAGRGAILADLNDDYCRLATTRLNQHELFGDAA